MIPLTALLVALGWAWGRRVGRWVAAAAVGALVVLARPEAAPGCLEPLDLERPVTLVGRLDSAWVASEAGWRARLSIERARQGSTVLRCRAEVRLGAGGETAPIWAERIRVRGFLGRSQPLRNGIATKSSQSRPGSYRLYLKSRRFVAPAAATGAGESAHLGESRPAFGVSELFAVRSFGRRLRQGLAGSFRGVEDRIGVQAARSLLLGDKAGLDADFQRSLRRFGLSHLFAVSGLHVALVGLLVHWLLGPLGRRPRLVLTASAVLGYLLLVGARPSILRATAMFAMALGAVSSQRPPHSRQALCLAAAGLIALDPALISSLGFRLTVSATAGILWLTPALESRWIPLPRTLRRSLAATVGAQLGSLPWTVSSFSLVHPLAPVLNLLAVPWMAAVALLSGFCCAAMRAFPGCRGPAADLLDLSVAPIGWLGSLPASGWTAFPVATGFLEACLLAASLAGALLLKSTALRLVAAAVASVLLAGPSLPAASEMIAIDVGQGDAILVHDTREAILVDGGGWRTADIGASVLVPTLAGLGIRRLSAVFVTHPDVDHCRGLLDLSYYLPIDRVFSPPGVSEAPCVRRLVSRPGARWRELWSGQSLRIGRIGLEVLHPLAGSADRGNNTSLVLRAVVGDRSMLLGGDIEARSERELLARLPERDLRAQVLKLPHHGSRTSTTAAFLDGVAPKIAVASSGRNNHYGHPSSVVLERCQRRAIRVLRTDRDGMIRLQLEPRGRVAGR